MNFIDTTTATVARIKKTRRAGQTDIAGKNYFKEGSWISVGWKKIKSNEEEWRRHIIKTTDQKISYDPSRKEN